MSIIKDWRNSHPKTQRLKYLFNIPNWLQVIKYRRQRADRGWSDKDTWGAGEHILQVTSDMLKRLDDKSNPLDWDEYFETNFKNIKDYTNLTEVARDIDQYLEFQKTMWIDRLEIPLSEMTSNGDGTYGDPKDEKAVRRAMRSWYADERKSQAKARKAMIFVADNFPKLWW